MTTAALTSGTALTSKDRHRLLADGMRLSANDVSRAEILAHLTNGGFAAREAEWSLATIERQLVGKRDSFDRARLRALLIAAVQILAAVVMVVTGAVGGKAVSIVIGVALVALAARRFVEAFNQTFGNFVLAGY